MGALVFSLSLIVSAGPLPVFVRGDVNQDGIVGIGDLVALKNALAGSTAAPPGAFALPDAADVDDDGTVTASDFHALLNGYFCTTTPSLSPPFPSLGPDPTADLLPEPEHVDLLTMASPAAGAPGEDSLPGGGSDLQFIRFARNVVLLQAGHAVRIPLVLHTQRSLGGISVGLAYERRFFSTVRLSFDGSELSEEEGLWAQSGLREQGHIGFVALLSREVPRRNWRRFCVGFLTLVLRSDLPVGAETRVAFQGMPMPGNPQRMWIDTSVADPAGRRIQLPARQGPLVVRVTARPVFVRGEVNGDGSIDPADAVSLLMYLFENGVAPSCPDAADVNDDGALTIGDPLFLLGFLFSQSSFPIPAPYPNPDADQTPDALPPCTAQPLGLVGSW